MQDKSRLRETMRKARREHVLALPEATRGLILHRPPVPVAAMAPEGNLVGLYHASRYEAPTRGYAQWFFENGRRVALPAFTGRDAPMHFRLWDDPYEDQGLATGPWGQGQPEESEPVTPDIVIIPLLAFTAAGDRLGQGAGHYDRWLAEHPDVAAIGLAWDCQRVDALPLEAHDRRLRAVVTPTRIYEGDA